MATMNCCKDSLIDGGPFGLTKAPPRKEDVPGLGFDKGIPSKTTVGEAVPEPKNDQHLLVGKTQLETFYLSAQNLKVRCLKRFGAENFSKTFSFAGL